MTARTLRYYQTEAIEAARRELETVGSTLIVLPTGGGKCLGKDTPVLMFDGTTKLVQDVVVGDLLMGPDSRPRCVLSLARGREPMYRIVPRKGDPYTVNESHILSLKMTPGASKGSGKNGGIYTAGTVINISVRDYLGKSKTFKRCAKGWRASVEWPEQEVPLHPYLLGLWLGDGTRRRPAVSKPDREVEASIREFADDYGLRVVRADGPASTCPTWAMVGTRRKANPVYQQLRALGVTAARHVPLAYLANSRAVRLDVLAGLLDSDGHMNSGGFDFISKDKQLAVDVAFLCRSLGLAAYIRECVKRCQNGFRGIYHRVTISGDCSVVPTRILRKKAPPRRQIKDVTVTGIAVESLGVGDYYGFEIDGDRLFLLGDFTVTHNTVLFGKLIAEWGRGNVLVLAHRTELLEQAANHLERELGYRPVIEQAERGVESGGFWHGGAVLVGSVQTLRSRKRLKKFADNPFDLIVIDEAHHATAKSYRTICEYFLSLNPACKIVLVTATPNRTDKIALGTVCVSCAYQYPIHQAIEDGYLVPVRQESVVVEGVDFDAIPTTRNEFGEVDFAKADLEAVMTEEGPLWALAKPVLDKADGRRGIIFAAGVAHAHLLAAILNREQPGCAAAVDGKTDPERRKQIVGGFAAGHIQFLTNYGIFCEGFDCPAASLVVMGRPTKSKLTYTQMLGRVLRPLDGVADGWTCNEDRRLAILTSAKPYALCLDFVGNSRHKIVTVEDVLGGNYAPDVHERAKQNRNGGATRGDVTDELRKANAEIVLEREQSRRRNVRATVSYTSEEVSPFGPGGGTAGVGVERTRGGSTDGQIGFLMAFGVDRATAAGYTRRQAAAVIDKYTATRCTDWQRRTLARHGFDSDVPYATAKATCDRIKASDWTLRGDEA